MRKSKRKKAERLQEIAAHDAKRIRNRDADRTYAYGLAHQMRNAAHRIARNAEREDWRKFGSDFERAFGKVEELIWNGLPYVRLLLRGMILWETILREARRPLVKSGLGGRRGNEAKKSKVEQRIARLQEIRSANPTRTRKHLAEDLGVESRTIQRYLKRLKS